MKFLSTRGKETVDNASYAIVEGLAADGGLFVPQYFPKINDLEKLLDMDYPERAAYIIGKFLEEYDNAELLKACRTAYSAFQEADPAPVVKLDDNLFVLELFHGPTLAFKDVALTILPYLLRNGADRLGIKDEILILVATSGDTGKAALEGFKDKDGIKINVFYPSDGVSDMQKLQMRTQKGDNVNVVGVKGNFDDCQTAVKKLFSNKETARKLKEKNVVLSSANSINFGRLVPQVVYYFSAYCDLVSAGEIKIGEKVNFTVPTGNFGNILAGYYAKQMGLPIDKLICASNSNNVLTEFFASGTYDANREFFTTMSPSMDILISSNLERLIFEISGRDTLLTEKRMAELIKTGKYGISDNEREVLGKDFMAGYCDEDECLEEINSIFDEYGYVCDPHTAVALKVAQDFGKAKKNIVLSTASPYKFTQSVLKSITGKNEKDAFKAAEMLEEETAAPIPTQIVDLKSATVRFNKIIDKGDATDSVMEFVSEK